MGNAMDQPLKSAGLPALDDAFQLMFKASRAEPAHGRYRGAYRGEWGFNTLSKLKPVFHRSAFNRLADLDPP